MFAKKYLVLGLAACAALEALGQDAAVYKNVSNNAITSSTSTSTSSSLSSSSSSTTSSALNSTCANCAYGSYALLDYGLSYFVWLPLIVTLALDTVYQTVTQYNNTQITSYSTSFGNLSTLDATSLAFSACEGGCSALTLVGGSPYEVPLQLVSGTVTTFSGGATMSYPYGIVGYGGINYLYSTELTTCKTNIDANELPDQTGVMIKTFAAPSFAAVPTVYPTIDDIVQLVQDMDAEGVKCPPDFTSEVLAVMPALSSCYVAFCSGPPIAKVPVSVLTNTVSTTINKGGIYGGGGSSSPSGGASPSPPSPPPTTSSTPAPTTTTTSQKPPPSSSYTTPTSTSSPKPPPPPPPPSSTTTPTTTSPKPPTQPTSSYTSPSPQPPPGGQQSSSQGSPPNQSPPAGQQSSSQGSPPNQSAPAQGSPTPQSSSAARASPTPQSPANTSPTPFSSTTVIVGPNGVTSTVVLTPPGGSVAATQAVSPSSTAPAVIIAGQTINAGSAITIPAGSGTPAATIFYASGGSSVVVAASGLTTTIAVQPTNGAIPTISAITVGTAVYSVSVVYGATSVSEIGSISSGMSGVGGTTGGLGSVILSGIGASGTTPAQYTPGVNAAGVVGVSVWMWGLILGMFGVGLVGL